MQPAPNTSPVDHSTPPGSNSARQNPQGGRPRVLDDAKRREICDLVAAGLSLRETARQVGCGLNTIRREISRNSAFADKIRTSETLARLNPLSAMQEAVRHNWRAAAWWLERMFPDYFGRSAPGAFGARHARELKSEVLGILRSEIHDPLRIDQIERRVRGAFEYYIRAACERRPSPDRLRQALKFFDDKNQIKGPLAHFGIAGDFSDFALLSSALGNPSKPNPGAARYRPQRPAAPKTEGQNPKPNGFGTPAEKTQPETSQNNSAAVPKPESNGLQQKTDPKPTTQPTPSESSKTSK